LEAQFLLGVEDGLGGVEAQEGEVLDLQGGQEGC
jgi:hypothetical protein